MAIPRLFLDSSLSKTQPVTVNEKQAHYLFRVMRLGLDDEVELFNGRDGTWKAKIEHVSKREGRALCLEQIAPQLTPPDLDLLFAPIKKARTDFIVEKAVELGVRRICPIITEFTNAERVRVDRLQAHAVEAAEQSGGNFVPTVCEPQKLTDVLANWPFERHLLFCDEAKAGQSQAYEALKERGGKTWAIMIGPEGGFSDRERARLSGMENALTISLGPRILRADTAAVAAITLWQSVLGDWV